MHNMGVVSRLYSASSILLRLVLDYSLQRRGTLRLQVQAGMSSFFSEIVPSVPDDIEEKGDANIG